MPKTLAVIVSYHPEASLAEGVDQLLSQVDQVVIVDNQSSFASQKILSSLASARVHQILNPQNRGVAEGFNQGIRWGLEQNFDYFLLMDQDSRAEAGMVKTLTETLVAYEQKKELVLVGPRHEDFKRKLPVPSGPNIQPIPLLITSGSLLSKNLINKVGLYDERLFIDHVDHDYCLRVVKKGGVCLQVSSAVLLQRFGEAKVKTVFGKSFFLQEYSAFRRYHMMRNRIVLYKRFGMFRGAWFWMDLRSGLKDLVKLVCFESQKGPKLRAVFRGFLHGLFWRENRSK